jgi:hypothetical protein
VIVTWVQIFWSELLGVLGRRAGLRLEGFLSYVRGV